VPEHMVQGVTFHLGTNGIMLSPTPIRVKKILEQLHRAVDEDALAPDEAAKLAGRVAFLAQAVCGSMARAATKAMYDDLCIPMQVRRTPPNGQLTISRRACRRPFGH